MEKLLASGRINFKMIRNFIVVAEELHFGKAAERLHISQPPLSQQIKELEDALGFQLFIRDSRNVELTKAGKLMQVEMAQVLDNFENSLNRVAHVGRNEQSHLNIGIISSVLWDNILEKLKIYQVAHPQITLSLQELAPNEQHEALMRNKIDIGFWRCADLELHKALSCKNIEHQRIVVAVSHENPLAKAKQLALDKLAEETFIFLRLNHSDSKNLYDQCLKAKCIPKKIYQFDEPQTQLAFVKNNLGIALVPESMKNIPWPNVKFIPLKEHLAADLFAVYQTENLSDPLHDLLTLFSAH